MHKLGYQVSGPMVYWRQRAWHQVGAQEVIGIPVHLKRNTPLAVKGHSAKGFRPESHRLSQLPGMGQG
jgi:hypothetical protein